MTEHEHETATIDGDRAKAFDAGDWSVVRVAVESGATRLAGGSRYMDLGILSRHADQEKITDLNVSSAK